MNVSRRKKQQYNKLSREAILRSLSNTNHGGVKGKSTQKEPPSSKTQQSKTQKKKKQPKTRTTKERDTKDEEPIPEETPAPVPKRRKSLIGTVYDTTVSALDYAKKYNPFITVGSDVLERQKKLLEGLKEEAGDEELANIWFKKLSTGDISDDLRKRAKKILGVKTVIDADDELDKMFPVQYTKGKTKTLREIREIKKNLTDDLNKIGTKLGSLKLPTGEARTLVAETVSEFEHNYKKVKDYAKAQENINQLNRIYEKLIEQPAADQALDPDQLASVVDDQALDPDQLASVVDDQAAIMADVQEQADASDPDSGPKVDLEFQDVSDEIAKNREELLKQEEAVREAAVVQAEIDRNKQIAENQKTAEAKRIEKEVADRNAEMMLGIKTFSDRLDEELKKPYGQLETVGDLEAKEGFKVEHPAKSPFEINQDVINYDANPVEQGTQDIAYDDTPAATFSFKNLPQRTYTIPSGEINLIRSSIPEGIYSDEEISDDEPFGTREEKSEEPYGDMEPASDSEGVYGDSDYMTPAKSGYDYGESDGPYGFFDDVPLSGDYYSAPPPPPPPPTLKDKEEAEFAKEVEKAVKLDMKKKDFKRILKDPKSFSEYYDGIVDKIRRKMAKEEKKRAVEYYRKMMEVDDISYDVTKIVNNNFRDYMREMGITNPNDIQGPVTGAGKRRVEYVNKNLPQEFYSYYPTEVSPYAYRDMYNVMYYDQITGTYGPLPNQ